MATQLLSGNALPLTAEVRASAESVLAEARDRIPARLEFVLDDGSRVRLPDTLSKLFAEVLHGVVNGHVEILATPDEVTTTVAAKMLGVSRPTLMTWIADGRLDAHKVGSHHRLAAANVLRFAAERDLQKQDAFQRLRALDEEMEDSSSPVG